MMSHTIQPNFDKKGLFILPGETASSYMARVKGLLVENEQDERHAAAQNRVRELFDADPAWVSVCYSNRDLYPWEAACTWYDDVPIIQLRKRFEHKESLFGLYSRDEILAHEYVHALRFFFKGSCFEEIFAYYTSKSFRGFLGPIFENPRDSLILMGLLFATAIVASLTMSFEGMWTAFVLLGGLSMGALGYFSFRLLRRTFQFRRCLKRLCKLCQKPLALMIRLTDEEIALFSGLTDAEIVQYVKEKSASDFRWAELEKRTHII